MRVSEAVDRVLLGESLHSIASAFREGLLAEMGLDPREAAERTFRKDTQLFVNKVCRELGDRHGGDHRAMVALREWTARASDYEPWDALLANFEFDGKDALVQRGRVLFPGPMTSHWEG